MTLGDQHDYPQRASLIGDMAPLFKAARRPLAPEWQHYGLDAQGWQRVDRLADRLVRHVYFEHLSREDLRAAIEDAVRRYRSDDPSRRPQAKVLAAETLDAMAQEPLRRTVYLGVEHLQLPHGSMVADVRFLDPAQDASLADSFAHLGKTAPALVCEVQTVAGTVELLRDRARDRASTALALIRQQNLFGFVAKIYLDQVLYRLDGTWTFRDGAEVARAGWWRENPRPHPMDLSHANGAEWRAKLAELSNLYSKVPSGLRPRVDTAIDWLDVAALSNRWRIIVPAVFTAMESLLVPEAVGLKAAVVTVRSVAVHVALGQGFFDPEQVMSGYQLRSELVHGTPTADILQVEPTDFAEFRRHWAFLVLRDYLELVSMIGATDVRNVVSYLDSGTCYDVCAWLEEHNGADVVAEYRKSIPARPRRT